MRWLIILVLSLSLAQWQGWESYQEGTEDPEMEIPICPEETPVLVREPEASLTISPEVQTTNRGVMHFSAELVMGEGYVLRNEPSMSSR